VGFAEKRERKRKRGRIVWERYRTGKKARASDGGAFHLSRLDGAAASLGQFETGGICATEIMGGRTWKSSVHDAEPKRL
jgi:hypothetical protein